MTTPIARVGIVAKLRLMSAATHLVELARWLDDRGMEPVFESETAALAGFGPERKRASREELPTLVDMLVVLGGDGTLLGMADRLVLAGRDIPILGVNFGHLGFLTEVAWPGIFGALEAVVAGTALIDERLMLRAVVVRDGRTVAEHVALNDVVIARGALSRIVELSVSVGGEFVARFTGDGLIVSSPTGSTAYNLSAGGPILHPSVAALVLTPIAPHTLSNRPVVTPSGSEIAVQPRVDDPNEEVFLVLDGQSGIPLQSQDMVCISKHAQAVRLIRATPHSYFRVLREKLKWAER